MSAAPNLLTVPETCEALRVGRSTLYRLFDGRTPLRRVKVEGKTLIKRADIDRYVEEHTTPKRAPKF